MKNRKFIAIQFDLMPDAPFNLAGEVIAATTPAPAPATSNNRTPELLFVDRAEMRKMLDDCAKDLR